MCTIINVYFSFMSIREATANATKLMANGHHLIIKVIDLLLTSICMTKFGSIHMMRVSNTYCSALYLNFWLIPEPEIKRFMNFINDVTNIS